MNANRRSSALLLGTILLAAAGSIAGCENKAQQASTSPGVTDVSTSATASTPSAYSQPTQMAAAPQPITYDTMPSGGAANTSGAAGGTGPYTVKRGDTLYSIARKSYGDGKQWQKIAAANPGLRPETLKVGQTITIP